ncbi:MAG: helix-turn-helix domain-containing protein, partial [Actinomycetota bacterium]|nr:helix-turn-helix domain-containing protein [Actinomycetota bacterium]
MGELTGYSASRVSRCERGIAPLTDVAVLHRFAAALAIPQQVFGLAAEPPRHRQAIGASARPRPGRAPTV